MVKIFGIPIILSILLGLLFPYIALYLMPWGILFLFLLMFWSSLTINWGRLKNLGQSFRVIIIGLFFLFIFFPLLQSILAKWLIADQQLVYGLIFSSLTPVAMVAPFFTKILKGDEELSFLLLITSMVICPFITPFFMQLLNPYVTNPISVWLLFRNMVLLISIPLFLGFLVYLYLPKLKNAISTHLAILNTICLSILIFIFFGTALHKINLKFVSTYDIIMTLVLVFCQDFLTFFLSRLIFTKLFDYKKASALIVSISMKNVAIAAGLLIFYDPKAALPPALAFIAHACFFNFIPFARFKSKPHER